MRISKRPEHLVTDLVNHHVKGRRVLVVLMQNEHHLHARSIWKIPRDAVVKLFSLDEHNLGPGNRPVAFWQKIDRRPDQEHSDRSGDSEQNNHDAGDGQRPSAPAPRGNFRNLLTDRCPAIARRSLRLDRRLAAHTNRLRRPGCRNAGRCCSGDFPGVQPCSPQGRESLRRCGVGICRVGIRSRPRHRRCRQFRSLIPGPRSLTPVCWHHGLP